MTAVPVLFVHYGEDKIRGSERALLDLLGHLDRDRFSPSVWCNAPAMASEVARLGVPVSVDAFTILFHWDPPRFAFGKWAALVREGLRLVRARGIRLIHANSGAPVQWMLPVARHAGIPILCHIHGEYTLRERCTLGLHHVSLAVGASRAVVRGLEEDGMPEARVRVIHNGIDFDRLRHGDATALRRELGIRDEEIVATAVGALVHLKGFDVFIRAAALLRAGSVPIRVIIVGDGPERARLTALVADLGLDSLVHFVGARDDVGAVFRDATDIAVVSSRAEAFGLTALEAATFGVPTVGTRVGGLPEIVRDDVTGILVPSESPSEMAAALSSLATDRERRLRLGATARELAEADFGIGRNVKAFEETYAHLVKREPAPRWFSGWGPWRPWRSYLGGVVTRKLGGRRRES